MSDDVRVLLERGAGLPRPRLEFDRIWRRSRVRRARVTLMSGLTVAALIATAVVVVPEANREQPRVDQPQRVAPASTGTWQRMPPAPIEGRWAPLAAWTGKELLVWGGGAGEGWPATGAAFDPVAREWRRLAEAPLERSGGRTAVWTGRELILWGGEKRGGNHEAPDSGAAYDPKTDSWRELPEAPAWSFANHTAVWTGEEMIVWGGVGMNRGAAFDPVADEWRYIAPSPIEGRHGHTAVWTGTEMLVWGGRSVWGGADDPGPFATGAAYDPASDTWRELSAAPVAGRDLHTAAWSGSEMIVWGGWSERDPIHEGAAYDPAADTWRELPEAPIRSAVLDTPGVWTGRVFIVLGGGGELASYAPAENQWTTVPPPPTSAVDMAALVAAGDSVFLWGGALVESIGHGPDSKEGAILRLDP